MQCVAFSLVSLFSITLEWLPQVSLSSVLFCVMLQYHSQKWHTWNICCLAIILINNCLSPNCPKPPLPLIWGLLRRKEATTVREPLSTLESPLSPLLLLSLLLLKWPLQFPLLHDFTFYTFWFPSVISQPRRQKLLSLTHCIQILKTQSHDSFTTFYRFHVFDKISGVFPIYLYFPPLLVEDKNDKFYEFCLGREE